MTSQEQLAKIGQAALDAKVGGLGLPPRVSEAIREAVGSEPTLPDAPGDYIMKRSGYPDRTAYRTALGHWSLDERHKPPMDVEQMALYLNTSGRVLERIYTATEAQKLAADAVNLSESKLHRTVEAYAAWRRRGQLDIIGYIESIHRYRDLVNELVKASAPGGIIHVKVNG